MKKYLKRFINEKAIKNLYFNKVYELNVFLILIKSRALLFL